MVILSQRGLAVTIPVTAAALVLATLGAHVDVLVIVGVVPPVGHVMSPTTSLLYSEQPWLAAVSDNTSTNVALACTWEE